MLVACFVWSWSYRKCSSKGCTEDFLLEGEIQPRAVILHADVTQKCMWMLQASHHIARLLCWNVHFIHTSYAKCISAAYKCLVYKRCGGDSSTEGHTPRIAQTPNDNLCLILKMRKRCKSIGDLRAQVHAWHPHTAKTEPLREHAREIAAAASHMLPVQNVIPSPHL